MKILKILLTIFVLLIYCVITISCKDEIIINVYDDDILIDTITVNNGKTTLIQLPQKDYYKFNGCTEQRGIGNFIFDSNGNSIVKIENNMTVFVNWEPVEITITFDPADGELYENNKSSKVKYNDSLNVMPRPIKNNYDFIGWFDEKGNQYSKGEEVLNNKIIINAENYNIENNKINLIAKYDIHKYKVTYNYNDGITPDSTSKYEYNYKLLDSDYPSKDTGSQSIKYWATDPYTKTSFDGVISSDITLYAIWSTYKNINLHYSSTEIIKENFYEDDNVLNDGYKEGYTFDGWYENSLFTGNKITSFSYNTLLRDYYAKFIPNQYKVNFETGEADINIDSITVIYDNSVILPNIEKNGYIFKGWYYNDQKVVSGTWKIADNVTLIAKFDKTSYTIDLNSNGGICDKSEVKITLDEKVNLPIPTKQGYKFVGWFNGENKFTDSIWQYTNDLHLKAEWEIITYKVNLNLNGGSCSENIIYFDINNPALLPNPTKKGHQFRGWYYGDNKIANNTWYELENITAKAIWDTIPYQMSFVTNNGKTIDSYYVLYGDETKAPENISYADHVFKGWTFNISGFSFGSPMPDCDVVATANWVRVNKKIEFSTSNNTRDKKITDDDGIYDYIESSMNKKDLLELGYTKLNLEIKFDCYEEKDGYQDLWIQTTGGTTLSSHTEAAGGTSPWYEFGNGHRSWITLSYTCNINIKDLTDTCSFKIEWGAHSEDIQNSKDDWKLGYTVVTIKAIK